MYKNTRKTGRNSKGNVLFRVLIFSPFPLLICPFHTFVTFVLYPLLFPHPYQFQLWTLILEYFKKLPNGSSTCKTEHSAISCHYWPHLDVCEGKQTNMQASDWLLYNNVQITSDPICNLIFYAASTS